MSLSSSLSPASSLSLSLSLSAFPRLSSSSEYMERLLEPRGLVAVYHNVTTGQQLVSRDQSNRQRELESWSRYKPFIFIWKNGGSRCRGRVNMLHFKPFDLPDKVCAIVYLKCSNQIKMFYMFNHTFINIMLHL